MRMIERDREIERHTALLPRNPERLTLIGRIVNGILQSYVSEFFDAKGPRTGLPIFFLV